MRAWPLLLLPLACTGTGAEVQPRSDAGQHDDAEVSVDSGPVMTACGVDVDGDGYSADPSCPEIDCDEANRAIFPGAFEACNGLDDDCDQAIDEDLGEGSCGLGLCRRSAPLCVAGRPGLCQPGPTAAELCNNLDDDCDGDVDEDLAMETCGVGACARQAACVAGQPGTCTPGPPGVEACNRVDDDCNDIVDDGFRITVENTQYTLLATQGTGCDGAGERIGQGCNTAMHRFCAGIGCSTSGFGPLENNGDLSVVACIAAEPSVAVPWASLAAAHAPCDGTIERIGPNCNAAIHRYCASQGYASGFGPVEADGTAATITCLRSGAATVIGTTYTALVLSHDGCNGTTARIGPACNAAISRHCSSQGYRTGYGPVENSDDNASIVCVSP